MAILDGDGLFLGWVTRGFVGMLEARLNAQVEPVYGKVLVVESFEWIRGGGHCFRGHVTIL